MGFDARYVFYREASLNDFDAVVLPGGFSYGDYLRPGAIASRSNAGEALRKFRGPILGICNGFQILTELGLLPGALTRNRHCRFECRNVRLRVEAEGVFTGGLTGRELTLPIAHADGRYHADSATLEQLEGQNRIAFRYIASETPGMPTMVNGNPNGSAQNIAGIYSEDRRVLGLMPHPERATEAALGMSDGKLLFESLASHLDGKGVSK